jgi:hypothetical protein
VRCLSLWTVTPVSAGGERELTGEPTPAQSTASWDLRTDGRGERRTGRRPTKERQGERKPGTEREERKEKAKATAGGQPATPRPTGRQKAEDTQPRQLTQRPKETSQLNEILSSHQHRQGDRETKPAGKPKEGDAEKGRDQRNPKEETTNDQATSYAAKERKRTTKS